MEWIASFTGSGRDPLAALAVPPDRATMVELRLDLVPDIDCGAAVAACPLPVVATLRSAAEGGRGPDNPADRRAILDRALDSDAVLVDLEAARDLELIHRRGIEPERIILSWHDPEGTPPDLEQRRDRLLSEPARWVKLVPTARTLEDLERVVALLEHTRRQAPGRRRLLAFAMGHVGLASRYLAPLLGPPVMFTAWDEAAAAAPGQLTAAAMSRVIGHLEGPPRTVYGVVGANVSSSLSPTLHAAGHRAAGRPDVLLPFSVEDRRELGSLWDRTGDNLVTRLGFVAGGWAVTTPYKDDALHRADQAVPRARRAGAANTLLPVHDRWIAENTDIDGVVGGLNRLGIDPAGRPALVQGTGGAGRAAAVGLDLAGAAVTLRGRDEDHTTAVAEDLQVRPGAPGRGGAAASILVNASPLGRDPGDPLPFSPDEVEGAAAVVEMVYGADPTPLEQAARAAGVPVVSGRMVLTHQGIAQLAAFTRSPPPLDAMRAALDEPGS